MTYKEPKSMEEIHKIREKHYRRTKNMSPDERVRETHRIVEKVLKERNLMHIQVNRK